MNPMESWKLRLLIGHHEGEFDPGAQTYGNPGAQMCVLCNMIFQRERAQAR